VRSRGVIVDEDEERDPLVTNERFRVAPVTRSDRDDVCARTRDLVVALAQLRGMLAAVQSTEMSEEHQHDRPVAPEITDPVWLSGGVDQRRLGERSEIHYR